MTKSLKSEYDINSISSDEEGADAPKASVGKAMFMFLKAFIGSGVLFLPKAFDHAGLLLSIAVMVVIAIICLFAYLQLVKTQMLVGGSYGDVGQTLYGKVTRYTILSFIALSQMGFVCSYFVFIAGNLVNIVDVLSHCAVQIDQKYYIWFPLIVVAPLVLIRHIAKLSFTAIIADLFILFGLVCCIYFSSQQLKTFGVGPEVKMANPSHFILTVGTAVFSFEGIGLVIPIVESMERPERFPFVVCVGVSVVCVIYIIIGAVAYLAYGSHIQAAVVYNFPQDHGLTISVQLLYSIAIVLTAPLQLFPATKILEGALFQKCLSGSESNRIKWIKNVFRLCLLSFCALIAFVVGGDNLDIFVSLVGSLACVPLCFIFPGMLHYRVANNRLEKIGDLGLCVFGVVILILTLYVTISSFITPEASGFVLPPYCPIRG
ncbi:transmembrane amino acid transporter protein-domain-containing protein [Choanephora cucurbitarum]|nr:transmembrane amino acid transporter protein-domain-containing protein [Choanephora cucurbitarum]